MSSLAIFAVRLCIGEQMPSTNPRYVNWKARERVIKIARDRAASGEPCGICGQPIDMSLPQWFIDPKDGKRKRAPWSCECDEIVPVSLGGSPIDEDNIQPVHRACNARKGNGIKRPSKIETVEGTASSYW